MSILKAFLIAAPLSILMQTAIYLFAYLVADGSVSAKSMTVIGAVNGTVVFFIALRFMDRRTTGRS